MGLRFEHPEMLGWLAVLPLVVAMFMAAQYLRRRRLERFGNAETVSRLNDSINVARRVLKNGMIITALALGIVALARPQYGFTQRTLPRRGVDVMVAIDVSSSMFAQDIKGSSRLQRARDQLKALIRSMHGDRVGIIAFAGEAYLQCPLTSDYGIAQQVLDLLSPDAIPIPGTAIGRAIALADENFEKNDQGQKVLVLLTDGEDQGSDPVKAAQEAAKNGMIIHAIGIGSDEGAPIPMSEGGLKKDSEGRAVNTRLDFETLKKLAAATGGVAIKSRPTGFMELDRIVEEIDTLQKRTFSETERIVYQERFQWFLLLALLLLLGEMCISERKKYGKVVVREKQA